MTKTPFGGALALPLLLCAMPAMAEETASRESAPPLTDTIVVTAQRKAALTLEADPVDGHASLPDAAGLTARLPGAALVNNGAISGQVQFRGLFSDRLAIRVGGQSFQTGGPNAMDPPLHYAPAILVDSIAVTRGAAPVSAGPGMGALIDAKLKSVNFSDGSVLAPQISLAASFRSADQGYAAGGVVGLANQNLRLGLIGSQESGGDYRIPGGTVRDTGYQRLTYGLSLGFRRQGNSMALDLRRQETGPSGNPPYAMDIDYFQTSFARLAFDGRIGALPLTFELSYVDVQHGMDNHTLRPAPASPAQYRFSYAEAQTLTGSVGIGLGPVRLGGDLSLVDRTVTITNPGNAAFYIASLDRVAQSRVGIYLEGATRRGGWQGDLGVRVDLHDARMAAPRVGPGVPPMIVNLANATAANNAPREDGTWDAVLRLWQREGLVRPRLVLARKSRTPNAVERFSWLPTEASGGLADGNIYIGRQSLRPEVACSAELGVDLVTGGFSLRPSLFYRRVDGYIQGTPVPATMPMRIAVATANGDSTPLIYSNVDAQLYGFDADLSWQLTGQLRLDATLSYVRGERRDIADNLYRIAPLNARVALHWNAGTWSMSGELIGAAAQNRVSATNSEQASPGWVTANLWFGIELSCAITLSGGIENLFDRRFANHLSGRNRVSGSDVMLGERMPAAGRSLFVRVGFDL